MERFSFLLAGASALALASAAQAETRPAAPAIASMAAAAQTEPVPTADQPTAAPAETPAPQNAAAASDAEAGSEVVVTGIRQSLERAAQIKQNSVQVVDSIVAQDIGKLPDPTTAAALQRVPGIQVSVNRNNELSDVRVRGLPDILTTVNGREVFTTTGRVFNLQDMPAEALARVDAYKSQTADLIEGGLAGILDLQLNKPFNFKKPTAVVSARANYGLRDKHFGPQLGLLLTNRWDTPIGEIGLLANGTYMRQNYTRANINLNQRRSSLTTPFGSAPTADGATGLLLPNIIQYFPETGFIERQQFNASAQWQASPAIQVYAEGFYTYFHDRGSFQGVGFIPYTPSFTPSTIVSLSGVTPGNQCITAQVDANGQNPTNGAANKSQTLCQPDRVTFSNAAMSQSANARDITTRNKQIAGGVKYDQDGWKATLDAAFQRSRNFTQNTVLNYAQRLSTFTADFSGDGPPQITAPNSALIGTDNLIIRQAFQQNFQASTGTLLQIKADGQRDFDNNFLKNIQLGGRYARRAADFQAVNTNPSVPAPNAGGKTPNFGNANNEANLVFYNKLGFPSNALQLSALLPSLNGGARVLVPNTDFLLSEDSLNRIRALFGVPLRRPFFDPGQQFDASERTFAGYAQANYDISLGGDVTLDGVLGARFVETKRVFDAIDPKTLLPLHSDTTNRDVLPAATARLKFGGGFQARAGYQKSIRRPNFEDLNPAVNLQLSANPLVQNTATAGNPNLKEQKSDSYDATLEYYFHGGYVAVAGYYRDITNRVITSPAVETFGGIDYRTSRPRNVGQANLKGVEVSSQYFFDFLPGAFSGLGLQGSFTYSDSKIGGTDPLAGLPLQGVSKYNYTTGLLYDKHGISGRLVYTFRSRYFDTDASGTPSLRPLNPASPLITYVRPAGRLDFSVGVDVTDAIRFDIGGTNILKNRTDSYYGYAGLKNVSNAFYYDETTYTAGFRVRF